MTQSRRAFLAASTVCAFVLGASWASASTITFTTSSPNSATATVTTAANTLTLQLTNTTNDPTGLPGTQLTAGELLSGFGFDLGLAGGSLTSGTGTTLTITDAAGNYTPGGSQSIIGSDKWATEAHAGLDYFMSALNVQPDYTIIGGPDAVSGKYDSANASLLTGSHNPFTAATTSLFVFTIPGLTENMTVSNVTFRFGTDANAGFQGGNCTDCGPGTHGDVVPEPTSLILLGSGLMGFAAAYRRRRN